MCDGHGLDWVDGRSSGLLARAVPGKEVKTRVREYAIRL